MTVRIRLKRMGSKHKPRYRIIVADSHEQRDGKAIEELGYYNPTEDPVIIEYKKERVEYWKNAGAQPSDTVRRLLAKDGLFPEIKKTPVEPGVSKKEKKARAESK